MVGFKPLISEIGRNRSANCPSLLEVTAWYLKKIFFIFAYLALISSQMARLGFFSELQLFPNTYAATGNRTTAELHLLEGPFKDALLTELHGRG